MFDPRNNLANEVSAQLITHFGDKVFRTIIPRNIRLAEAPSFGRPVLFHDKESRGALSYLALAGEMIRREEEEEERVAAGAAASAAGSLAGTTTHADMSAVNAGSSAPVEKETAEGTGTATAEPTSDIGHTPQGPSSAVDESKARSLPD
jgi:hypothetical protein